MGDEVFISEAYGPGSSLLRVSAGRLPGRVARPGQVATRPCSATGTRRSATRDTSTAAAAGIRARPSFAAIEWKTGKVAWRQPGLGLASLLYVDGHFVCLAEDGALRLIKATPERYVEVAKAVVREKPDGPALFKPPAWAAPILSHGLLYVRGDDRLVCLRLIAD